MRLVYKKITKGIMGTILINGRNLSVAFFEVGEAVKDESD